MKKLYSAASRYLIFFLPFVFLIPRQFSKIPHNNLVYWIVIMLGLLLIPVAYKSVRELKPPLVWVLLFYLLGLFTSLIFSVNIHNSLSIFLIHLSYLIVFISGSKLIKTYNDLIILTFIFLSSVAILSVLSFYRTVISRYNNLTSEGVSFQWAYFGHNHIAILLVIAIPLGIFFWYSFTNRLIKLFFGMMLAFFLLSLLIAYSRTSFIALIFAMTAGWVFLKKDFNFFTNFRVTLLMGSVLIILFASLLFLIDQKPVRSFYSRIYDAQKGIQMFRERPVAGYGLGTYGQVNLEKYNFKTRSYFSHNLLVQTLSEGGLLLGLSTVILLLFVLFGAYRTVSKTTKLKERLLGASLWVGLMGVIINEMTDFDLQLPAVGLLFWLFCGLVYFRKKAF